MPVPKMGDRMMETSTSTGTGNMVLLGAVPGYQDISSYGGDPIPYVIEMGTDWETGIGHISAGELVRDTMNSSSTGSPVSFGAGTKRVWVGLNSAVTFPLLEYIEALEKGVHTASASTTDNTPTVMDTSLGFSGTSASGIELLSGYVAAFNIIVTAARDNGDCRTWEVKGLAKNVSGTESIVDSPATITTIADDAGASTWTVTVGVAADKIEFIVTGDTGHNIEWRARGVLNYMAY